MLLNRKKKVMSKNKNENTYHLRGTVCKEVQYT